MYFGWELVSEIARRDIKYGYTHDGEIIAIMAYTECERSEVNYSKSRSHICILGVDLAQFRL